MGQINIVASTYIVPQLRMGDFFGYHSQLGHLMIYRIVFFLGYTQSVTQGHSYMTREM